MAVGRGAPRNAPREAVAAVTRRSSRAALVGSYTTAQLAPMLRLAALRGGVDLDVVEGGYDLYRQELLDPASEIYAAEPDFVVLAVHEGALALPVHSDDPEGDLEAEVERWRGLWEVVAERTAARVVQHTFAIRTETAWGHLAARLPGSRLSLVRELNARLGREAGDRVLLVDCERLAADVGKRRWFDDRYWHLAKQAVALDVLPLLARHTAAVVAGDLGLARKCLVLDLDDTLWGGIVGEDGLAGLRLGGDAEGEAFAAFQESILALRQRGVVLAVASKNDEAIALEVFDTHPDMRIRREHVACVAIGWEPKPDGLRRIAAELGLGLDALVLADDNPAERELVRRELPEVDVLRLPPEPALYARALSDYPWFEASAFSAEDAVRSEQYRARAAAARLSASATDLESFLRDLDMRAELRPFDELRLPRIVQLLGKTNQFNLTSRRHGEARVRELMADPDAVTVSLTLRDRLGDHGLVGLAVGVRSGDALEIDTLLLSCRVIGRTAERALLGHLAAGAERLGCARLRGVYLPTPKNRLVRGLYAELGFAPAGEAEGGGTVWELALADAPEPWTELVAEEEAA